VARGAVLPSARRAFATRGGADDRSPVATPLRLGSLTLGSRVTLAPLERVSDAGFRELCFRNGAGFTWTEMVYASALARKTPNAMLSVDTFDAGAL